MRRSRDGEAPKDVHPKFKVRAVKLVTEDGRSVAEVARDLDLSESLLCGWKQALAVDGPRALPGHGNVPAPRGRVASLPGREPAPPDGARHPETGDGFLR